MAGRLPYRKRNKYTHMIGENADIWSRFIDGNPERFDTVDYDFRVGEGMRLEPGWPDHVKRDATALTQKRIDVLAWRGEKPTIIEVKRRVGLSTLGQVLGYKILFMRGFKNIEEPELLVVTGAIGEDDRRVLESHRVPVEVIA